MKKLEEYSVEELNSENIVDTVGGSFGYDVGWAIYWGVQGAFSGGSNPEATAGAAYAYVMHYQ